MTTVKTSVGVIDPITPSTHLVGWWPHYANKVDALTGNLLPDLSGLGNDGLHNGGANNISPTFFTATNGRGTYLLPNDVFRTADNGVFDIDPNKSVLVSFRINAPVVASYPSSGNIIGHRAAGGNPGWEIIITTAGTLQFTIHSETVGVKNHIFTTTPLDTGADLHIACWLDRETPEIGGIIEGVRQNRDTNIASRVAEPIATTTDSVIGGSCPYTDTVGRMDHINDGAVYPRVWDLQVYIKTDGFPAFTTGDDTGALNKLVRKLRLNPYSVLSADDL